MPRSNVLVEGSPCAQDHFPGSEANTTCFRLTRGIVITDPECQKVRLLDPESTQIETALIFRVNSPNTSSPLVSDISYCTNPSPGLRLSTQAVRRNPLSATLREIPVGQVEHSDLDSGR